MEQEKNIEVENTVEVEKTVDKKNYLQIGVIVLLLLVIAFMWFFLWKKSSDDKTVTNTSSGAVTQWNYENLAITVYEDKRCTNCPTDEVIKQLKLLPSVSWVEIVRKDFSEKGVSEFLTENAVKALPLIVFSTNNFDVSKDPVQMDQSGKPAPKVNSYLQALPKGWYTLAIGATFNPFEKRSAKGHLLLDKAKLETIKTSWYLKGNKDAKITWLEYSDLECPFCAKLHKANTVEDLTKKYGDKLNIVFNSFPLQFHNNAEPAAEILECLGEQKWSDAYYSLIHTSYSSAKALDTGNIDTSISSSKKFLVEQAVALWANEAELNKCIDSGKFKEKVKSQMETWTTLFGITGTPGNILINNATGEYEVISWAYPTSEFEKIIDEFLK